MALDTLMAFINANSVQLGRNSLESVFIDGRTSLMMMTEMAGGDVMANLELVIPFECICHGS